eukprot:1145562-Pelagomonas_calceolata.AAC.3
MFTPKIKDWRKITYTDGSVIKQKDDDPPPLSGSGVYRKEKKNYVGSETLPTSIKERGVYKPEREIPPSYQHLQLHIKPNDHGPTNTINKAGLAGTLVALQQGQIDIASDNNTLSALGESPYPIHFYKVKAHSGIIDNEGAHACARTAALTDTTDIALPDARYPFHNIHWLSLKTSHGQTDGLHRARAFPIHYPINLDGKQKVHMHKKHKLGSVDTSGYHYQRWQKLSDAIPTSSPLSKQEWRGYAGVWQRVSRKLVWVRWVSGSMRPQGTRSGHGDFVQAW